MDGSSRTDESTPCSIDNSDIVPVIEISIVDLKGGDLDLQNSLTAGKKKLRRPDVQIYQPSISKRTEKRQSTDGVVDNTQKISEPKYVDQTSADQKNTKSDRKKKPDLPVYVPKHKKNLEPTIGENYVDNIPKISEQISSLYQDDSGRQSLRRVENSASVGFLKDFQVRENESEKISCKAGFPSPMPNQQRRSNALLGNSNSRSKNHHPNIQAPEEPSINQQIVTNSVFHENDRDMNTKNPSEKSKPKKSVAFSNQETCDGLREDVECLSERRDDKAYRTRKEKEKLLKNTNMGSHRKSQESNHKNKISGPDEKNKVKVVNKVSTSRNAADDPRLYDPNKDSKQVGESSPKRGLIKLANVHTSIEYQKSPYYREPYSTTTLSPDVLSSGVAAMMSYFSHSDYNCLDEDDVYQRIDTNKQQKVGLLVRDVVPLDRQLTALLSRRLESEAEEHLQRLRTTVRDKLEHIVLLDVEYSVGHNVDQWIWKSAYHSVYENLKREIQEEDNTDTRAKVSALLKEANDFYQNLLAKMEKNFKFVVSDYTSPQRNQTSGRHLKFALIMTQRILICLGDISRYTTLNEKGSDYGKSRRFYLQASHVMPRNGKPYHQLAVVALNAKRKLDTVFYFVRSLAASNAFLSAKESLRALFHDVIRKYEHSKQQAVKAKIQQKASNQSKKSYNQEKSNYKRIEIWISPLDGSSISDQIDDADYDNLKKMPYNELYKKLMTTFLCCQGKLFSKVGMEDFPEASSELLYQFEALLNHTPVPFLDVTKLIQMFAICFYSVQHSGIQANVASVETEKCRSYTQEQAVLLCLDMYAVIVNHLVAILTADEKVLSCHLLMPEVLLLLPAVTLASDWMTCHPNLWNPLPCPRDPQLGPVLDPWMSIAKLANVLAKISTHHIKFYNETELINNSSEFCWLPLQEETDLRGFLPLMNLASEDVFIKSSVDQSEATQCFRVTRLITFADYLCGIEPPMLEFDTQSAKYSSVIEPSLSEKTVSHNSIRSKASDEEEDFSHKSSQSEDEGVSNIDEAVSELRQKKKELSRQLELNQKQQKAQQDAFERESHLIQLEIRPLFLVPDTNCFIDYFRYMKTLIELKKFIVVVPLVVINELDGLAKNLLLDKYSDSDHGIHVQEEATKAIEFLELQFESRNSHLRALTTSGTELSTIMYRSEEINVTGNNDDRILSCCLHYCSDNPRDYMSKQKESTITLHREVVLITDDRNLRLKAHTRNVPVKDLLQFMEWAKIR